MTAIDINGQRSRSLSAHLITVFAINCASRALPAVSLISLTPTAITPAAVIRLLPSCPEDSVVLAIHRSSAVWFLCKYPHEPSAVRIYDKGGRIYENPLQPNAANSQVGEQGGKQVAKTANRQPRRQIAKTAKSCRRRKMHFPQSVGFSYLKYTSRIWRRTAYSAQVAFWEEGGV